MMKVRTDTPEELVDNTNANLHTGAFLLGADLGKPATEQSMVCEDPVARTPAANPANRTSIGIGDEKILKEAKYNFKDFTFMDTSFIEAFINKVE